MIPVYQVPEQKKSSIVVYRSRKNILRHTALETGLFSNALKGCLNKIDNIQEKDHKSWRDIEKDDLENFALV